jgi:hypothetical protein
MTKCLRGPSGIPTDLKAKARIEVTAEDVGIIDRLA